MGDLSPQRQQKDSQVAPEDNQNTVNNLIPGEHYDSPADPRIEKALDLAVRYANIDGGHHKMWVIDQIVRVLAGERYDDLIRWANTGEDGPDTYEWDTGIAP